MKVVQLLPELNEGGVERGVVELNREFVRQGIESHVISHGGKLVESIIDDGGIHHHHDICSKNILTAWSRSRGLRALLKDINPDIIHARSRVPAWLSLAANRKLKIPFVTTVHGLNSVNPYSRVMTMGDKVICVSEVVHDYVVKNYKVDKGKLRIIQRGVDLAYFDPHRVEASAISAFKKSNGIPDGPVITSVGRITWLKDYETFINAIAEVRDNHKTTVTGVIVGGVRSDKQDYLQSLIDLAREKGVGEHIIFTGNQQDMRTIYAMSDVVVNASLKMGNMGRTVVEALAVGKPVIATTFPGLNNLVQDGINGAVIQTRDIQGMASAILRILDDGTYTPDAIRQSVPEAFTLDAMVKSVVDVYHELVTSG